MSGEIRALRPLPFFLVLASLALAACDRDKAPMTPCEGDRPAVERIEDVGPPNCPKP